jgi:hypothetical protein
MTAVSRIVRVQPEKSKLYTWATVAVFARGAVFLELGQVRYMGGRSGGAHADRWSLITFPLVI